MNRIGFIRVLFVCAGGKNACEALSSLRTDRAGGNSRSHSELSCAKRLSPVDKRITRVYNTSLYGDHALYEREPHDDLAQDAERSEEIHKSDGSRLI